MKTINRFFTPSDRYEYDFKRCTYAGGWAQLDTSQDASYFGQWINPKLRQILCYCEGDVSITSVDTDDELVEAVDEIKSWNENQGHRFIGINPGFSEKFLSALIDTGLKPYVSLSGTEEE